MTVHLNTKSLNKLEEESSKSIHFLPCKIQANRKANVSQYFSQCILDKDDQTREVTFRGRPFSGKVINLPESYRGVVFLETLKPKSLKADRKFHAVRSFRSFSYWNWDKIPSKNDPLMCALDWLDISKAVHSPVNEPISKNESKDENDHETEVSNCNGVEDEKANLNGEVKTESMDVNNESDNTENCQPEN